MTPPQPTPEHLWLKQLLGEWHSFGDEGESNGTESVTPLGDLWVVAQSAFEMGPGQQGTSLAVLGYDPAKGRFVGSWSGSMMAEHWVYDGWLNEQGQLVLESEGPAFDGSGAMQTYRDTWSLHEDGSKSLTASVLQPDGAWVDFMTTRYERA